METPARRHAHPGRTDDTDEGLSFASLTRVPAEPVRARHGGDWDGSGGSVQQCYLGDHRAS